MFPETAYAMENAKLFHVNQFDKSVKDYGIQFPGGVVPIELKIRAQQTRDAKVMGAKLLSAPDNLILSFLRVKGTNEAAIGFLIKNENGKFLYSLSFTLYKGEKHLFDKAISALEN